MFIHLTISEGFQSVRHGARHRGTQRKVQCCLPGRRGKWARQACQQRDRGLTRAASQCCGLTGGRVTHGPEELWGCAIRSAARASFLRHSKLTAGLVILRGSGGRDLVWLPPLVGFTSESRLLPGDQCHTCSKLALFRNRTEKNIQESMDEVWEAGRPGAFSERKGAA